MIEKKTDSSASCTKPLNTAHTMPKKPPAPSLLAAKLKAQARQKMRDESAKRRAFAMGKNHYTEGK